MPQKRISAGTIFCLGRAPNRITPHDASAEISVQVAAILIGGGIKYCRKLNDKETARSRRSTAGQQPQQQEIENLENLICQPILPTIIKAKLYELLSALIQLDDETICEQILKSKILSYIIIDYNRYENNSNILILPHCAIWLVLV